MNILLSLASETSEWELEETRKSIKSRIHDHLFKFGGQNSTLTSVYKNSFVDSVVKEVTQYISNQYCPTIEARYEHFSQMVPPQKIKSKSKDTFFSRTLDIGGLTHESLLLPEDNLIFEVLPFLMTCYSINLPHNKLDPKNDPVETATVGWQEIFQDLCSEDQRQELLCNNSGNRPKNVDSLCNYFVMDCYSKYAILTYEKDAAYYKDDMDKATRLPLSSIRRAYLNFWEYYHQFIIFCAACHKIERKEKKLYVNYTLSMALFASIWIFLDGKVSMKKIKNDFKKGKILELVEDDESGVEDSIGEHLFWIKITERFPELFKDSLFDAISSNFSMTDDGSD